MLIRLFWCCNWWFLNYQIFHSHFGEQVVSDAVWALSTAPFSSFSSFSHMLSFSWVLEESSAVGLQDLLSTVLSYSASPLWPLAVLASWTWLYRLISWRPLPASLCATAWELSPGFTCTFSVFSCLRWQNSLVPVYPSYLKAEMRTFYFLKDYMIFI